MIIITKESEEIPRKLDGTDVSRLPECKSNRHIFPQALIRLPEFYGAHDLVGPALNERCSPP
jgi:hypothetical protein